MHLTAECLLVSSSKMHQICYNLATLWPKTKWAFFTETPCSLSTALAVIGASHPADVGRMLA